MFFFFALGATGGVTALLTSDKPIFERYCSQNSQFRIPSSLVKLRSLSEFSAMGFTVLMQ
jgi:hypothetical protein